MSRIRGLINKKAGSSLNVVAFVQFLPDGTGAKRLSACREFSGIEADAVRTRGAIIRAVRYDELGTNSAEDFTKFLGFF